MSKTIVDADQILKRATPVDHQHGHEIQPWGHVIRMPIALAESACKEAVENLNQLLADTMTLRDLYKKHHWIGADVLPAPPAVHVHTEQTELIDATPKYPVTRRHQPRDGA